MQRFLNVKIQICAMLFWCWPVSVLAVTSEPMPTSQTQEKSQEVIETPVAKGALNDTIEDLKAEVLKLNRDLFILEEDLLYPASTSVTLYVSMNKGEYFEPNSVEIQINGKRVTSHLYTEREVNALTRGGIQKVHQGNVKKGEHELVAIFVGNGPEGRDYRRALRHTFTHTGEGVHLELQLSDDHKAQQPIFSVKEWRN